MATQNTRLVEGTTLGTGNTTLYTVPDGKRTTITAFIAANFDGSNTDNITVWLVPSGQSVADDYKVEPKLTIDSEEVETVFGARGQTMHAGATIVATSGNGSRVTVIVSGIEELA